MLISVAHRTIYRFDDPVHYGLQRLRLTPLSGPTQKVLEWNVDLEGAGTQVNYDDHFGNRVTLIRIDAGAAQVKVVARGKVETGDRAGVIGSHQGRVPLWFYLRSTELTSAGSGVASLLDRIDGSGDEVEQMHNLSQLVREAVEYQTGGTESSTSAEQALAGGSGVCQDHAHVFATAARELGVPCRYVSGYLVVEDSEVATASHAWVEAHLEGLGWVGFDVSNGISADERYVRLAVGRDYREAAPVVGMRYGSGGEDLSVELEVASQSQQQ